MLYDVTGANTMATMIITTPTCTTFGEWLHNDTMVLNQCRCLAWSDEQLDIRCAETFH